MTGDTDAIGGFVGIGFAEEIALAPEQLYLASEGDAPYAQDKPRNLTLVHGGPRRWRASLPQSFRACGTKLPPLPAALTPTLAKVQSGAL